MTDDHSNDDNFFLDDGESTMPQRSIFDFGALTQSNPANMLPAFGSQQETKRERRNRLARERRARSRVVQTQKERARLVEERRLNRNRRRRERYAAKRDRRARSLAAIDARLAGLYDDQADQEGPLRLQTRFGNVSVLNARENLFRKARKARTRVQEERFLAGTGNSVTYLSLIHI